MAVVAKSAPVFHVKVQIYAPYPITSEHTLRASKPWVAVNHAMKAAYKSLPKDRVRKVDFYLTNVKRV